jgi:hypothetical protein
MAIDIKAPEPPPSLRYCVGCGRRHGLKGILIHWPDEECKKDKVTVPMSRLEVEPFSTWVYQCRWCKGIDTKRKKRNR